MTKKAPVSFIFPASFSSPFMSFHCIPYVGNTLRGLQVSQRRLCVHTCPFLPVVCSKSRQAPPELNESTYCHADLHASVCIYEAKCLSELFIPSAINVQACKSMQQSYLIVKRGLTGNVLLFCERIPTIRTARYKDHMII